MITSRPKRIMMPRSCWRMKRTWGVSQTSRKGTTARSGGSGRPPTVRSKEVCLYVRKPAR